MRNLSRLTAVASHADELVRTCSLLGGYAVCVETSYEGTEVRGEVTQYAATDGFRRYVVVDGRGVEMGESDWESSSERHVRVSDDLGSIDAGSSDEGFGCYGRSGVTVVVAPPSADPYSERYCF